MKHEGVGEIECGGGSAWFFFFQGEGGIRGLVRSRGPGDVYKEQALGGRRARVNGGRLVEVRAAGPVVAQRELMARRLARLPRPACFYYPPYAADALPG